MASSRLPAACVLLAFAALFPGCFLDSSAIDTVGSGSSSPGTGGSGAAGASGGGGSTASTSGTGGTGGTAGTGGGTTTSTPLPCGEDADCPDDPSTCLGPKCDKMKGTCTFKNANEGAACDDPPTPPDECHVARCKMGACTLEQLAKDTVVDDTKNGDCKKYVCSMDGEVIAKPDDGDKPQGDTCTPGDCMGGTPIEEPGSEGMSCGIANAGACCKGTCCYDLGSECTAAGCCSDLKVCGDDCCSFFQICVAGKCVGF